MAAAVRLGAASAATTPAGLLTAGVFAFKRSCATANEQRFLRQRSPTYDPQMTERRELDSCDDELIDRMIQFIEAIGIETRRCTLDENTSLPGLSIDRGVMLIDLERLLYPGDLLHEAGHVALTTSQSRPQLTRDSQLDLGDDLAAIAWSYAAALHLGIDPAVVFHEHGYQGSSTAFLSNFANGRYVGVPVLVWAGMTIGPPRGTITSDGCYPSMLRWLRE